MSKKSINFVAYLLIKVFNKNYSLFENVIGHQCI